MAHCFCATHKSHEAKFNDVEHRKWTHSSDTPDRVLTTLSRRLALHGGHSSQQTGQNTETNPAEEQCAAGAALASQDHAALAPSLPREAATPAPTPSSATKRRPPVCS